jgi:SAM-dependent methyltransferase
MHAAPDGSPVELYRRLPDRSDDAALIHRLLPPGGSALDLGCGTGRLAEPLARLGHPVTGVDNEPEMLTPLRSASPVCADITELDLDTRFDAVLLMSHLVNAADDAFVAAALRTVRRHVRDGGGVIVERYPPGWVLTCTEATRERDGVRFTLTGIERNDDGVMTATMRYAFDGLSAEQPFSAREVDDQRLARLAGAAGLDLDSSLSPLNTAGTLMLLRPRL